MSLPSAAEPGIAPALLERFRGDLDALIDLDADRVLVGVSGGPDSVALLLLTHAVIGERCFAATVDHGLRPEAADEARFVTDLCAGRGIPHAILTAPLPDRAAGSANVSGRARQLRYDLLHAHREAIGATAIATAHHADDQRETMVMRLNRGAGVGGLAGIRRRGDHVIRPLLDWRRHELAEIVRDAGVASIDDPTNRDDRFDRARLRKQLADADWLDPQRVALSAQALADADAALMWSVDRLLAERLVEGNDSLTIEATNLPHEYRRRVAAHCIARLDPDWRSDGPALERLLAQLDHGRPAMLGNVRASADATGWHFAKAPPRRSH